MQNFFFDDWQNLLRILISTILGYLGLILLLRISGKRTLAKMNAFDFIVTIALGSVFGAFILNKTIPLLNGLLAAGLLIGLQYLISFISVRNKYFKNLISSDPTMLVYKGIYLHKALRKERITEQDIVKAVRESGKSDIKDVDAVILESTGDITVISSFSDN